MLQVADFEPNSDFLPFFQFLTALSTVFFWGGGEVSCSINYQKSTEFIDAF